jgi:hypothetical protein
MFKCLKICRPTRILLKIYNRHADLKLALHSQYTSGGKVYDEPASKLDPDTSTTIEFAPSIWSLKSKGVFVYHITKTKSSSVYPPMYLFIAWKYTSRKGLRAYPVLVEGQLIPMNEREVKSLYRKKIKPFIKSDRPSTWSWSLDSNKPFTVRSVSQDSRAVDIAVESGIAQGSSKVQPIQLDGTQTNTELASGLCASTHAPTECVHTDLVVEKIGAFNITTDPKQCIPPPKLTQVGPSLPTSIYERIGEHIFYVANRAKKRMPPILDPGALAEVTKMLTSQQPSEENVKMMLYLIQEHLVNHNSSLSWERCKKCMSYILRRPRSISPSDIKPPRLIIETTRELGMHPGYRVRVCRQDRHSSMIRTC